jgi:hypothetical protein
LARIDDAFCANADPLFGPNVRDEFARLKAGIINRLPHKLRMRAVAASCAEHDLQNKPSV